MPYDSRAARLLERQTAWLAGWVATVRRLDRHDRWGDPSELPRPSMRVLADYVTATLPVLRHKPEGPALLAEARHLRDDIAAVIDLPETLIRALGPCPKLWPLDGHEEPCPGEVEAVVPVDESKAAILRCTACKAEWPSWQWTRAGAAILARKDQLERQASWPLRSRNWWRHDPTDRRSAALV
jgi:hypothetical protein